MDEKLGIRFRIMQNAAINAKLFIYILHFCLRKEVKNVFYAGFSTESELCISQKTNILLPQKPFLPSNQI